MKTAANVLGSAFFAEGYEVQDAPRYGAERRGAPVFAYVRASKTPIHERGVITQPGLVVVADASLITMPGAGVLEGVTADTLLVMPPQLESPSTLQWPCRVLPLPVSPEQMAADDRAAVSAICAGAAASLTGVIRRQSLVKAVNQELAAKGGAVLADDLMHALQAYDTMQNAGIHMKLDTVAEHADVGAPGWIDVPRDDAAWATPTIHAKAASDGVLTGSWRRSRPVIDEQHCNRCSWICGTLCPDSAIQTATDRTPHIDYDHCKGCLVCVEVCPAHAIHVVAETMAAPT
jgi:pyruvate ferredoxin oxidoreductase gamma subunit